MCGFDGFFSPARDADARRFAAAHATIRHRGPDDEGFTALVDGRLTEFRGPDTIDHFGSLPDFREVSSTRLMLGHRRLAIIDLTYHGHEPFASSDGSMRLVYNGELFNYLELRDELVSLGRTFRTDSDTEVVLQAYEQWGTGCFRRFNGMWALAIYDGRCDSIVLCRDRFGIKPLFYAEIDGVLHFASETKYLSALLGDRLTLDPETVRGYIGNSLLNIGTHTFWNEVSELQPGHWLEFRDGRTAIGSYWDFEPHAVGYSDDEALARFAELFEDSLRLRMRSDVEVGTLLSGGLDSTLIVASLDRLGFIRGGNFKSFSAVFPEPEFSERRWIDLTLAQMPVVPHFVVPKAEDVDRDLDTVLHHMDQPVRSLSVYSQYLLYKCVKTESAVTVLLNGQGADELFGGYGYHYYYRFAELLRSARLGELSRTMRAFERERGVGARDAWVTTLKRFVQSLGQAGYFNHATFSEVKRTSLREYLAYDDRNSMAWSLEARVPFLDYRLVEFAFTLASSWKISGFENKRIEREYARGRVPEEIRTRRDKMGFVSPQELWQRGVLAASMADALPAVHDVCTGGLLADGASEERRYRAYLDGDGREWDRAWRVYCLVRWLRLNGRL